MLLANATPGNLILKKYPTFCCSQHRPDVLAPSLALLFFTHLLVFGTISRTISHSAFHRPLQRNVSSRQRAAGRPVLPAAARPARRPLGRKPAVGICGRTESFLCVFERWLTSIFYELQHLGYRLAVSDTASIAFLTEQNQPQTPCTGKSTRQRS